MKKQSLRIYLIPSDDDYKWGSSSPIHQNGSIAYIRESEILSLIEKWRKESDYENIDTSDHKQSSWRLQLDECADELQLLINK